MKKITSFYQRRLNNAYHVNFHSNVLAMIEQYGEDSIGLSTSILNQYKAEIGKETDAVKRSTAMAETPLIREQDEIRDNLFRYVRNVLVNLQYSPDAQLKELYATAKAKILTLYPASIAQESDNEESAHLRGFILDVRTLFKDKLTAMGIDNALKSLETANDRLQELYVTRAAAIAANSAEATSAFRAAVEETYAKIVSRIVYTAQLTELTDESSTMMRQTCEKFIDAMNQLIARTLQSATGSKNGASADDKETGDAENTENTDVTENAD